MTLIRPRITDFHNISVTQADLDFAIPFLNEDIPLYVDPFLLWKSPSLQDQALHTSLVNSFNHFGYLARRGRVDDARRMLMLASECNEVGLGLSKKRKGLRIGSKKADEILWLFDQIPAYKEHGFIHFEEIQFFVDGIGKDRISDFVCSFLKSFLIDYTIQECEELGIPSQKVTLPHVYSYKDYSFKENQVLNLPVNPSNSDPILFVPKRWLRFNPWINFEEFFRDYCPKDNGVDGANTTDRVKILTYNRDHYDVVREYVQMKLRTQKDCKNDPLFAQIPVLSAKRKLNDILRLPTGKTDTADAHYETATAQLVASLLYPDLDFAAEQSRTDSGRLIRDLVFYNNRSIDFLNEIYQDYGSRQIVFELKNVHSVDRDDLNQLNRYLDSGLGKFGVLLTRNSLSRAMFGNTIDLWSGQRRCIIALTDQDLELMVNVFEGKERKPIDVLKKKYIEFQRACPS